MVKIDNFVQALTVSAANDGNSCDDIRPIQQTRSKSGWYIDGYPSLLESRGPGPLKSPQRREEPRGAPMNRNSLASVLFCALMNLYK